MSNVGEFPWSWFLEDHTERRIRCRLITSSIKREIRDFHAVVVQWRQRNVQKAWCTFKVVVYCDLDHIRTRNIFGSLPSFASSQRLICKQDVEKARTFFGRIPAPSRNGEVVTKIIIFSCWRLCFLWRSFIDLNHHLSLVLTRRITVGKFAQC